MGRAQMSQSVTWVSENHTFLRTVSSRIQWRQLETGKLMLPSPWRAGEARLRMPRQGSGAGNRTMRNEQDVVSQRATVLRQLARSLADAVARFEKGVGTPLKTFPDYKRARAQYLEIQAMIFTITEKAAEAKGQGLPEDLKAWLLRTRLRAISAFTRTSLAFFREPPALLVQALGAYEILEMEKAAFQGVLADFDMMLMEAAVDDRGSQELDEVRVDMEAVVQLLEGLLTTAPPPLMTFDA